MSLAADPCNTLIRELLEWIGPSPRPYAETLEAWKDVLSKTARVEEANDRRLLVRHRAPVRPPTLGEAPLRSTSGPMRGGREAAWL